MVSPLFTQLYKIIRHLQKYPLNLIHQSFTKPISSNMFVLITFYYYFYFATAKRINMPELYIDNEMGESEIIKPIYENEDAQTIWILALTEQYYDSMTLRLATSEEEEIYKQKSKTAIERLRSRGPRVKKDEPDTYYEKLLKTDKQQKVKSHDENLKIFNALKLKISRLVNKLALSMPAEPSDIMAENIEDIVVTPKIAIYFQGPYASINIQQGSKRRLYFIYPSPFPEWFHKQIGLDRSIIQENATSIEVPESVRNTLLEALLDWLNIYLGYVV